MSPSVGSVTSRRVVVAIAMVVAVLAVSSANASTVTITSTLALAGCISQGSQGPLLASCSYVNPGGTLTSAALADVLGGHLGASASSSIVGSGSGAQAYFLIGISVQGGEPGDSMLFNMKLDGSYSPGGGGNYQLTYDVTGDQGETIDNAVIGCSTYNDINHGTSCWQGATSGSTGAAGNATSFVISMAGVDTIYLTGSLSVATGNATASAGAFADFFNSAHLTITVPDGTTVNNFPGGALFQTAGAPAPEPASALLLGSGALGIILRRKRLF